MNASLRFILRFFLVVFSLYVAICLLVYFNQESMLFHPKSVAFKKEYDFELPFKEQSFNVEKRVRLNGVLFETPEKKGLVFFVHGNAGNVADLKGPAEFYTSLGYDFFAFDFRGFGKSTGTISSEAVFYSDAQLVYDALAVSYAESDIIVAGYSIGTATAAMIAANNHPKKLILMAPYYSMEELAKYHYAWIPSFLVAYKFNTFAFLEKVEQPVLIGHGRNDGTIPLKQSLKLKKLLKKNGKFVILDHEGHNGVQQNEIFQAEIRKFLEI